MKSEKIFENKKYEIISQNNKKITLKTIADLAGVSPSCVTRCINNSGYVSQKKRDKIDAVMKDLHYIPNQSAKCLRGGSSKMLGYIYVVSQENIFFTKLATWIERMSFEKGYGTISLAIPVVNEESLDKAMNLLMTYRVDGIILNLGSDIGALNVIENIVKQSVVPVVMVERSVDIFEVDKILVDNTEGSYIAVNRLLEAGHRKIVYLGVVQKELVEKERYSGYLQAMKSAGNDYAEKHSYFVDSYSIENGYQKCIEIVKTIEREEYPTAIFAASDILAAGVYQALNQLGVRIPEQISVIGYDDTIAEFMSPPLSTMELPVKELSEAALEVLIEKIENGNDSQSKRKVLIGPRFVHRNSIKELL